MQMQKVDSGDNQKPGANHDRGNRDDQVQALPVPRMSHRLLLPGKRLTRDANTKQNNSENERNNRHVAFLYRFSVTGGKRILWLPRLVADGVGKVS
jgi:hypothetical protein